MKLIRKINRDNNFYRTELKDFEIFKNQLILQSKEKVNGFNVEKYTNYKEVFLYFYDSKNNLNEVQVMAN